jgi:HSP20 family molecular chaperone IbpA
MSLTLFNTEDLFRPFYADAMLHPMAWNVNSSIKAPEMRSLPLDVVEDETSFMIKADLPGVNKEDVHVKSKDGVLTISVESTEEKKDEKKDDKGKVFYHSMERSRRFMSRSITMPKNADLKKTSASLKDGVLSLSVPKHQSDALKDDGERIAIA